MKLIIGLGNPGEKYKNNRHNVGHMFIDYIRQRHPDVTSGSTLCHCEGRSPEAIQKEIASHPFAMTMGVRNGVRLVKTTVFMNQSGAEIKKLVSRFALYVSHDLIIVHDDLDIPLGKFKIQKSGGPKLHNGITSIEKSLETKEFWRVRIGVDSRDPTHRIDGETYVLQNFTPQEKENLLQVFEEVVDKLKNVFHNDLIQ